VLHWPVRLVARVPSPAPPVRAPAAPVPGHCCGTLRFGVGARGEIAQRIGGVGQAAGAQRVGQRCGGRIGGQGAASLLQRILDVLGGRVLGAVERVLRVAQRRERLVGRDVRVGERLLRLVECAQGGVALGWVECGVRSERIARLLKRARLLLQCAAEGGVGGALQCKRIGGGEQEQRTERGDGGGDGERGYVRPQGQGALQVDCGGGGFGVGALRAAHGVVSRADAAGFEFEGGRDAFAESEARVEFARPGCAFASGEPGQQRGDGGACQAEQEREENLRAVVPERAQAADDGDGQRQRHAGGEPEAGQPRAALCPRATRPAINECGKVHGEIVRGGVTRFLRSRVRFLRFEGRRQSLQGFYETSSNTDGDEP
jgi:hypothetical protein